MSLHDTLLRNEVITTLRLQHPFAPMSDAAMLDWLYQGPPPVQTLAERRAQEHRTHTWITVLLQRGVAQARRATQETHIHQTDHYLRMTRAVTACASALNKSDQARLLNQIRSVGERAVAYRHIELLEREGRVVDRTIATTTEETRQLRHAHAIGCDAERQLLTTPAQPGKADLRAQQLQFLRERNARRRQHLRERQQREQALKERGEHLRQSREQRRQQL